MTLLTVKQVALNWVGKEYIWGGDDPIRGFDCSGLVQELLAMVGMDPPGDQTAQTLYTHFENKSLINVHELGALAFYGKDRRSITHVAFCIDDTLMVEAGGGGSKTLTREDAIKQNAYIRVRPIRARKDLICTLVPAYPDSGILTHEIK